MAGKTTWTTSREDKLVGFCQQGLSMMQIAERLGVTKNAVISKLHRLGESRLDQIRSQRRKKKEGDKAEPFSLFDLSSRMCSWPYGDKEKGFDFCGRETVSKKSYCQEHVSRAYR